VKNNNPNYVWILFKWMTSQSKSS